jgi:hypothetical protein
MKPDEGLFRAHLGEAPFLSGQDCGKWGLIDESLIWPRATFWVEANENLVPSLRMYLRFNLEGYPVSAPTSFPWDEGKKAKLENHLFPKVPGAFKLVFRIDWQNGDALYAPCDRIAMQNHDQWKTQFPTWWWQSSFSISKYLEFVHTVLNPPSFNE